MTNHWPWAAAMASAWTGWWLTRAFWTRITERDALVRLSLAMGLGWAVGGVHYCLWRILYPQTESLYLLVDCVVIPAIAWWIGRGDRETQCATDRERTTAWRLRVATVAVVAAALVVVAGWVWREPLGIWDGWAIWNLKARFLYRGDWTQVFSKDIWFSHPDYPLLLPASIARLWTYLGGETTLVPQITSIGYTALVIALLFGSVAWLRGTHMACYAALLLVSSRFFLYYGGGQVADVPMSFHVLGAMAMIVAAGRAEHGRGKLMALAGVMAGCATMLKNEGLVICLALLAAAIAGCLTGGWKAKNVLLLAAGMVPGLLLVTLQKSLFAGASYLVADQPSAGAVLHKLFDLSRHRTIAGFLWQCNFGFFAWRPFADWPLALPVPNNPGLLLSISLLLVCGVKLDVRDRFAVVVGSVTIVLAVAAYYVTMLVYPHDLAELVKSIPRLQLHIWPMLILLVFLMARSREESITIPAGDHHQAVGQ